MTTPNEAYLQSIGVQPGTSAWQNCLEAMAVWGNNRWWLSDDPKERAYHQINEEFLLMSFSQFHGDVEKLLNRPVFTHEFVSPKFREEAERAWKYDVGCTSDAERQERIAESVKSLQMIAQEHGKETIIVEVQEQ